MAFDLPADFFAAAASRIMARCAKLRAISADPERYERLYLTPEHRLAAERIAGWMEEAGLVVRLDAAGNMIGRWEPPSENGPADGPALLLGSHFDTVRDAGTYDGQLGVVTAIEVAAALRRLQPLAFPIEVHAYADEEGTRFHTMLLGSGFVSGLESAAVLGQADADGVTIAEAMRRFGLAPERIGEARRQPGEFRAYLEVHIEQGPVLESQDLAVGTVTVIAGQIRGEVTLTGTAGHAGTVPMELRRDALAGAAECILAVESTADADPDPTLVATVGELRIAPGASNVIPGDVTFTVDLRSGSDGSRRGALKAMKKRFEEIAERRNLGIEWTFGPDSPAVACHPALVEAIDAACDAEQDCPIHLISGAGHDAIALARLCPVGMIFVRCKDGISHNPAESIAEADAGAGFATLLRTVLILSEQA